MAAVKNQWRNTQNIWRHLDILETPKETVLNVLFILNGLSIFTLPTAILTIYVD